MHNRPDIAMLRRYVRGELSPQQMYEVEQAAEADESLMDMLMGMEAEYAEGLTLDVLPELQERIQQRSHSPQRSHQLLPYRWIGLAASLLLVLGIGMYVFLKPENIEQQIVQNTSQDEPAHTSPDTNISSAEDHTAGSEETIRPIKNQEKALAYSNVEASATNRLKNSNASRQAALDTIPIQIIPSNAEELVSRSLNPENHVLASRNTPSGNNQTAMVSAKSSRAVQPTSREPQSVSLHDIKSITTGIIIDEETHKPIAGALIRDHQMNTLAKTDSTGRFIAGSTTEKPILNVQSAGFETANHVAEGAMRIALKRTKNTRSATPSNADTPATARTKSQPIIGQNAYQLYADSLARASKLGSGEVTLLFAINPQGRPIDITVKKSGGKKRDVEAIKILKNGPNWIRGRDNELMEWIIRF